MLDTKALAEATALIVREHIARATAPLVERIAQLEAAKAAAPDIASMIAAEVKKQPLPEAPQPVGPDMSEIADLIDAAVAKSVAALPAPKDGESFTIDQARALIDEGVKAAVASLKPAKDGTGLAGALIDRHGALVVTLTDGTTRDLGPVVGKDADCDAIEAAIEAKFAALPKPKDGIDGFGFDDLTIEHDGERRFVLRFTQGERVKEFPFDVPVILDRGVWREGAYKSGDAVTWAGSLWIAQKNTEAKPDSGDGWRLSVKRGRDGKDKV